MEPVSWERIGWEAECPFCDLADTGTSPCWRNHFPEGKHGEVIWSGEVYSVIVDTAPVVPGHLLIVPAAHIPAFAARPVGRDDELKAARRFVTAALSDLYQPPTFLEHGAADFTHHAGACVDHAHLHAVPGSYDLLPFLARDFTAVSMHQTAFEAWEARRGEPYVYCEEPSGRVYSAMAPMCSTQYLRRLVAQLAQRPERWNWRDCIRFAAALGIESDVWQAGEGLRQWMSENNPSFA